MAWNLDAFFKCSDSFIVRTLSATPLWSLVKSEKIDLARTGIDHLLV